MRILMAFGLVSTIGAQTPASSAPTQIAEFEQKIAEGRETVQDRIRLMNLYLNARNVTARRKQVLWLAEHHPEIPNFRNAPFNLGISGQLPDSVGFDNAAEIWRMNAAKPDAPLKVIANAAWFFRYADREFAWTLVAKASSDHTGDADIAKLRANIDVIEMGGLVEIGNGIASDERSRWLPAAKKGRADIESSRDVKMLIAAAEYLIQQSFLFNTTFELVPALADDDALDVARKWLLRAAEIDPANKEIQPALGHLYQRQAGETLDPNWKVELLRKSDAILNDVNSLPQLASAEFEAGNDDAASRVAHRMLDSKNPGPILQHSAHSILGRIAVAHDDLLTAKTELTASIPTSEIGYMPFNRGLAQDLLDRGEIDAVIKFLQQMHAVWLYDQGVVAHCLRLARSPGHPNFSAPFRAGADAYGRQPKLPEALSGKVVVIQFHDANCKGCAEELEIIKAASEAANGDFATLSIDAADQSPLAAFLEIEAYPTVVVINREGRVREYFAGRMPDLQLRQALDRAASAVQQRLPAPKPIESDSPATLAWSAVPGAQSYIVQLDLQDDKGWISDHEGSLRVIPSSETTITLDASFGGTASPVGRWRVFAVARSGPGAMSDWHEVRLPK